MFAPWIGPAIGYGFAAAVVVGLIWASLDINNPKSLNIALLIAGGLIGWTVGILITPKGPPEVLQFADYSKTASTFLSGYLIAKLDKLFDHALKDTANLRTVIGCFFLFVAALIVGAISTFVWRQYVSG
jgi:hypothetical protein